MEFRVVDDIENISTIVRGPSVQIRRYLDEQFGRGRWRKMKGDALIEWENGRTEFAEIHWFEAHGIGRRLMKRKRTLRR